MSRRRQSRNWNSGISIPHVYITADRIGESASAGNDVRCSAWKNRFHLKLWRLIQDERNYPIWIIGWISSFDIKRVILYLAWDRGDQIASSKILQNYCFNSCELIVAIDCTKKILISFLLCVYAKCDLVNRIFFYTNLLSVLTIYNKTRTIFPRLLPRYIKYKQHEVSRDAINILYTIYFYATWETSHSLKLFCNK